MIDRETFEAVSRSKVSEMQQVGLPHGAPDELRDLVASGEAFAAVWITGGVEGGNCWSEGGHHAISPQGEPRLAALEAAIGELGLPFSEGMQLVESASRGSATEHGYYGNSTDRAWKTLTFDDAYARLVELGVAERDADPRP